MKGMGSIMYKILNMYKLGVCINNLTETILFNPESIKKNFAVENDTQRC